MNIPKPLLVAVFCAFGALLIFSCDQAQETAEPAPEPKPAAEPEPADESPETASEPDSQPEPATEEEAGDESVLLSNVRQLTFAGRRAGEGYFSADGTKMVFQSEREEDNPFFQIYVLDLETGDTELVSPGMGKTTCAWFHPSGKKLLFASTHEDPEAPADQKEEFKMREEGTERRYSWDYDKDFEIYEYDLKTEEYTDLTNALGYDAEGAYSPNGKKIVFASNRSGYGENQDELSEEDESWFKLNPSYLMEIYTMDSDGSNVKRLTDTLGYDGGPFFNADGTKICWRRFDKEGTQAEVYTMNADGSDKKQLTDLGAMSWAPFFHPSGEYLIFATNLHGFANFELYLVDEKGEKEPVRVTYTDGFDGLPAFSPDGESLSWTSKRAGGEGGQIFMAKWDHQAALDLLGQAGARGDKAKASEKKPETAGTTELEPAITEDDLRTHIEYLSSDKLTGRLTGTEGEELATAYVAEKFESWGLVPFELDGEGYFDEFTFTAGVDLGADNHLTLKLGDETKELEVNEDWRPLSFSKLGEIDANEIVFAGYGIEIPEGTVEAEGTESEPYSSYVHLDVQDKWVMMLRFVPEDVEGEDRRRFMRFASLRYKAMTARQKGAKGVIFVSGPNSEVKDELVDLTFDASMADSGIAAISVTTEIGEEILTHSGENLKEIQSMLDTGEMAMGISIPEVSMDVTIDIEQQKAQGRNVVATLQAKDPEARKRPAVILGAHIDHLGNKPNSASRALGKEQYEIHHGADDNASGTAALMEIAQYLAHQQETGKLELERNVIFAAWSGEELGLIGSSEFVREVAEEVHDDPDAGLGSVFAANLNMDMIGRLEKTLVLQGIGSSPIWPEVIEQRNVPVGLPITTQRDTYLSTDATTFYLRGVPILSAFTGAHEDYHKPTDTVDKINFEGLQKVTRLMGLVARGLAADAEAPEYLKVERPKQQGQRARLRAYLGTIPDYSQGDIEGVKLSGVGKGGPAEKAGVKGGDVVVGLAGKEVKNIYDYTYILEALKVGETVDITVLRDGEKVELEITPESRE